MVCKLKAECRPWPSNKKVAFAIRDDDISYFTQPWMLDMLYSEAWRLGFKVSLAVIPNVKASQSSNVSRSLRGSKKFFPISENEELVDYLMEKITHGYVDIIQHGYTHAHMDGKPEFAINDFRLVDERLKKGNRLLRETFKRNISVFTAPHDKISRAAWKSISQNKMCLCRRFTLGRFLTTAPLFSINFRKLAWNIVCCPNPFKLMPRSIINLADVLVIQWNLLFSSNAYPEAQLKNAKEQFLKHLGEGEPFVMLHHHWEYFHDQKSKKIRQDLLASLNAFLNFVSSRNEVWKTTLSELCSWIKTRCR